MFRTGFRPLLGPVMGYRATKFLILLKEGSKKIILETFNTCGPERRAAVRKSKHPKRTLIGEIAVRKDVQRSGKASIQNAL